MVVVQAAELGLVSTQLPEASVDVIVRGRASRPELRFRSDPPMSESDVFALLVTGTTNKEGEGDAVGTKAASLLAAFQNPVLQRELQDSLGIDRVGVGFGENVDQPIVTVGKRVSRKVYVEGSLRTSSTVAIFPIAALAACTWP